MGLPLGGQLGGCTLHSRTSAGSRMRATREAWCLQSLPHCQSLWPLLGLGTPRTVLLLQGQAAWWPPTSQWLQAAFHEQISPSSLTSELSTCCSLRPGLCPTQISIGSAGQ